jgi:hypothetical protein
MALPTMTYNRKRLVAGLLLLLLLAAAANHYLRLGFVPRFSGLLMMLVVLAILVFITRFGPTRSDFEEYRNKKKTDSDAHT